jgi:AcrR family transcriptional regulator
MTTRARLLDTAEELFAEKGFHATSIRDITDAADANVAAIHYHFGSKEQLLRAVTDRIVEPLNQRRLALLADVQSSAEPPSIESVLEAFLRPDIETMVILGDRQPTMARFLGRTYSEGASWIQEMATAQFAPIGAAFQPVIAATLPHLAVHEIGWRLRQIVAVVLNLFTTYPDEGLSEADAEATIERLVTFLAPAMSAPMPAGR